MTATSGFIRPQAGATGELPLTTVASRAHAPPSQLRLLVDRATRSPRVLYWTLQVGGWSAFGLSTFLTLFAAIPPGQRWPMLASKVVRAAIGFGASLILTVLFARLRQRRVTPLLSVTCALAACVVLGALWTVVYRGAVAPALLLAPPPNDIAIMPRAALDLIFVLVAWSGLYAALIAWRDGQRAERARELSQRLAADARYRMLAAQLNPHFLFNALNSVRALTIEDPGKASDMITALSDLLRTSLARDPFTPLSIAEEIRLVEQYLALERVRFEERLAVEMIIDPVAANAQVLPNIIQPLVENAMKYGSSDASGVRHVRVRVGLTAASRLRIVVANHGRIGGRSTVDSATGIGLTSIGERLNVSYPGFASLNLVESDGWVNATVELPFDSPDRRPR